VLGDEPHESWKDDLEPLSLTSRFEKEVVFFHRKSKSLITADALLNLSTHPSRVTRAAAFLMGNTAPGKGYLERIAVRDYAAGRKQVDRILDRDIERIILAHGENVESDGRAVLRAAYAWLPAR
jgi:glyoxylase-like metal-dependent hydrolase (beta-lactamase superfamily II)